MYRMNGGPSKPRKAGMGNMSARKSAPKRGAAAKRAGVTRELPPGGRKPGGTASRRPTPAGPGSNMGRRPMPKRPSGSVQRRPMPGRRPGMNRKPGMR